MATVRPLRPATLDLLSELVSARLWGTNQQGGQDLFSFPSSNGLSHLSKQADHSTKKRGHYHHSGSSALSCPPDPAQEQAADKCCRRGCVPAVAVCALASCPGIITTASLQQHPGQAAAHSLPISTDKPAPSQPLAAPSKQPCLELQQGDP